MKNGTIDPEEILDLVDEKGKIIGKEKRAICHSNPNLIHPVVHCWIFNKKGQILWNQRTYNVESEPGKWDMSCGGHIVSGDNPKQTIKRILLDELGIKNVNFKLADTYLKRHPTQTEFVYLFYLVIDKPESSFKINKAEVQRVLWIDPHEAQLKYVNKQVESTETVILEVTRILQKRL